MSKKKQTDWNAIRAEYIGGGISQRKLADKYGVSFNTLQRRAQKEGWNKQRLKVYDKSAEKILQKTVNTASDNAAIAQRIKQKLLIKLEKEIDNLPEQLGSERFTETVKKGKNGDKTVSGIKYKLNDITQSFKALVGDLPDVTADMNIEDDPLTKSLKEFAEGLESGEENADK